MFFGLGLEAMGLGLVREALNLGSKPAQ